jgi:hypothetical protein
MSLVWADFYTIGLLTLVHLPERTEAIPSDSYTTGFFLIPCSLLDAEGEGAAGPYLTSYTTGFFFTPLPALPRERTR